MTDGMAAPISLEAYWLEEVVHCADRAHAWALAGQMGKAREEAGSLIELVRRAFGELGMSDPLRSQTRTQAVAVISEKHNGKD